MRIIKKGKSLVLRPVGKSSTVVTIQMVFLFGLFIVSCATGGNTKEFNRPYGVVRATVQKDMPRGIRATSRNGRTFESNYFIPRGTWDDDGTDAKERAFAKVTILNSSRPYQLEVSVYKQRKVGPGEYSSADRDDDLSDRLVKKITDDIANRREDRNIIDDFNAF